MELFAHHQDVATLFRLVSAGELGSGIRRRLQRWGRIRGRSGQRYWRRDVSRRLLARSTTGASQAKSGVPNRTTEMARIDDRGDRPKPSPNRPISGSQSNDLDRQHPANSRAFPDPSSDPSGKSLLLLTGWRWTESGDNCSLGGSWANWSLGAYPCYAGKIQGISPRLHVPGGTLAEFSKHFRCGSDDFPVIENRELIPTSREFAGIRSGL
jgi:hypothetical protein